MISAWNINFSNTIASMRYETSNQSLFTSNTFSSLNIGVYLKVCSCN